MNYKRLIRQSLTVILQKAFQTIPWISGKPFRMIVFITVFIFSGFYAQAQTTTIPAGSFIVNMGVTPQTVGNGLKPYGMLYELLQEQCPVHWVIKSNKIKDGVDFTYNDIDYKGGPFIIEAKYRTSVVNGIISAWQSQGVVGITTTAPVSVPVYTTLYAVPRWTMDKQNGSIAVAFFNNAGIPSFAYGGSSSSLWTLPADLDCCDDIFVMPHADPTWATHQRLYTWNQECKGAIWLGCHAGSALEDMFDNTTLDGDPIDYTQQTNFLSHKSGDATGSGPWAENALILWGNHDDGTLPYVYAYHDDPVMQFLGIIDAATQNGSEQIYIPVHASAGWRESTKVGVFDPDHPEAKSYPSTPPTHHAAVLAYGRGFGEETRGYVMLEASHNIAKSTAPASVAAQRAFFNFSFLSMNDKVSIPEITGIPEDGILYSGQTYNFAVEYSGNTPFGATYNWEASCGGTFTPSATDQSVVFTPPTSSSPINCQITVTVEDNCGRTSFDNHVVVVECNMTVATTVVNPCFGSVNGGSVSMIASSGTEPYTWSWTRAEGGSGSGTGSTISDLGAGTYTVTMFTDNGAGCSETFTVTLSDSPEIVVTATPVPVACNGENTGAINVSVSGGTPPYTYLWDDGPTTLNRSGLTAGTYTLTVTDSKGCIQTASVAVIQSDELVITSDITDVTCYDAANGIINLTVTGGTEPYTFLWNDGNSNQNRTDLAPGTYSVTVTDANNCEMTAENITISQPSVPLTLSETHVNNPCYGNTLGSIDLTVTGGTTGYTYLWTGPGTFSASTEDISNLAPGIYNVMVTDSKSCTSSLSVTITSPPALSVSLGVTDPTCPPDADQNFADGAITLVASGGTPGYTYSWTGPNGFTSVSQNISELIEGLYSVTITDANGCTISASKTLVYLNPNPEQPTNIQH